MKSTFLAGLLAAALSFAAAAQAGMEKVALPEVRFQSAALTVVGKDGEKTYAQAELERIGTWRMTTVTPWTPDPLAFDGVLLSDILAANGIADAPAIRVTAENGYEVTIPRTFWTDVPTLVATRMDGKPHTRRERGPIQFILPMSDRPELGDKDVEQNWVWMAARIEPVGN